MQAGIMERLKNVKVIAICLAALALLAALITPLIGKKESDRAKLYGTRPATIIAKGVIEYGDEIEVASRVSGTVSRMMVEEGDSIRRSAVVAELDDTKARAQLEKSLAQQQAAEEKLKEAQAGFRVEERQMAKSSHSKESARLLRALEEFKRQKNLYDQGIISLSAFERAKEQRDVTLAQVGEAKANLDKYENGLRSEEIAQVRAGKRMIDAEVRYAITQVQDHVVKAPIDGIVMERLKKRGEYVPEGSVLIKIADPAGIRIMAEIDESYIGRVSDGQEVEVRCDALPDKVFKGKVTKLFPAAKMKSQKTFDPLASFDIKTQKIHISLADHAGLRHGMTVTVTFLGNTPGGAS